MTTIDELLAYIQDVMYDNHIAYCHIPRDMDLTNEMFTKLMSIYDIEYVAPHGAMIKGSIMVSSRY